MTQAHQIFDIQQVPSLPVYWYDPATELVFSDGFTAPVLPHYNKVTAPGAGKVQENTRETAGKMQRNTSTGPGAMQENDPVTPDLVWLLEDEGMACIPMIPYAGSQRKHRVLFDRSIFLNQLNIKQMATITAAKIKNDAAFERTRENVAEFSRSGQAGKILRHVFREVLINTSDKNVSARLVKTLFRVVSTDSVNDRGERTVNNGEVQQLEGFNFNKKAGLGDTLFARYTASFDRATGQAAINIPPFIPKIMVQAAKNTTHYRISIAAATIDFDKGTHEYAQQTSADLPWDNNRTEALNIVASLSANTTGHVVVVVSIELFQMVNSKIYALKSGNYNAAAIVKVVPKV